MQNIPTAAPAAACTRMHDTLWDRASAIVERYVLSHVRAAGMTPEDIGLEVVEGEQPDRPGRPALRVTIGSGDVACFTWLDWNGTLSWGRPRIWLERRVQRQIARRRWMLAMVEGGMDPERAAPADRRVDPLLAGLAARGVPVLDVLATAGGASARYAISDGTGGFDRSLDWHPRRILTMPGLPAMDVHVDHDAIVVERMAFSRDVVFRRREDRAPAVRLGRHRLSHTAMFAMTGEPLGNLIASDLLHPAAMPVIDRMRIRTGGTPEALLLTDDDGDLRIHGGTDA